MSDAVLTRDEAERLLHDLWPVDDLPEAEHAAQVVEAYDQYLIKQGFEPLDPWIERWQQARVLKALFDGQPYRTSDRPMAVLTLLSGGRVVMDAGTVEEYPNLRAACAEAAARGFAVPDLPAPMPVAPVDLLPPRSRNGRWAAAGRDYPRGRRSAVAATSSESHRV